MITKLLEPDQTGIKKAASLLRQGEPVAIPTETVYGLAADATGSKAVQKIFLAKGRPQDNPLIVHIDSMEMLPRVVREFPENAQKLAEAFWPGPLTMILPKVKNLAPEASAGLDTVGVRMPANEVARAVIKQADTPLAAPSANRSGSPSPTTARHVLEDLRGKIPLILDGGSTPVGVESTVVSLGDAPLVLRPGFITAEEMEAVLSRPVAVSETAVSPLGADVAPESPGLKYKHYAPQAKLTLVEGNADAFYQFIEEHRMPGVWALCFEEDRPYLPENSVSYGQEKDSASQAAGLFSALRSLDTCGAKDVYARCPAKTGVGLAVYNRILRAAAFRVVVL